MTNTDKQVGVKNHPPHKPSGKTSRPKVIEVEGGVELHIGDDVAFGTDDNDLIEHLMSQCHSVGSKDTKSMNASLAMIHGLQPRDELEGMIVTQMVSIHNMALEMAKRTMLNEQTPDGVNYGVNRVTKLMRTFTAQMEALQKHRTKGQQTIQVQHVQVNEGGQAIVGNVKTGGGGNG